MGQHRPTSGSSHEYGERRAALIEATIRLVGRDGMRNFRYRSVAAEAGVAHPLITHHFGSLDALLDAAMDRSLEVSTTQLVFAPDGAGPLDFGRDFVSGVARIAELLTFQYHVMLESRGALAERRLQHIHEIYRSSIGDALASIGCPREDGLIELVYATLEGVVFHELMRSGSSRNELALDSLRQVLSAAAARV